MERLNAYVVKEVGKGRELKSVFIKVGAAFANNDGQGYSVLLDVVPQSVNGVPWDGKLVLRVPKEVQEAQDDQPEAAEFVATR